MIAAPKGATFWRNTHPRGKQSWNKMEKEGTVKGLILGAKHFSSESPAAWRTLRPEPAAVAGLGKGPVSGVSIVSYIGASYAHTRTRTRTRTRTPTHADTHTYDRARRRLRNLVRLSLAHHFITKLPRNICIEGKLRRPKDLSIPLAHSLFATLSTRLDCRLRKLRSESLALLALTHFGVKLVA